MTRTLAGWALLLAVITAGFVACHAATPPRFGHLAHLDRGDCGGPGQPDCPTCVSCHDSSSPSSRSLAPDVSDCAPCHQHAAQVLSTALRVQDREHAQITFPHREHLALPQVKGQCVSCHAGVLTPEPRGGGMPGMATCLTCHQDDFDQARCRPCHVGDDLARLVPQSFMRHDVAWSRRHGAFAAARRPVCQQCHTESQCATCHDPSQTISVEARRPEVIASRGSHRGDFLSRHPIEARSSGPACLKCHTSSQCDACHVERGVSANARGSVNPHPDGWLGRDTQSRSFHGRAARRNATTCAACHEQGPASNCIQCHRVGGPGGSPHPGGWDSSQSQDAVPCRYCHDR
jgi:predicted CXXCH cytochrome family protein